MKGFLIKSANGWVIHTLGDDVNHASQIFKLHERSLLSQAILRKWIENQTRTLVDFYLLDGEAFIPNPEKEETSLFNPGTFKHEVFAIKNNEAYIGYTTEQNSFYFEQVPYTEPELGKSDRTAQRELLDWLAKLDLLTDKPESIWEEFIKTR